MEILRLGYNISRRNVADDLELDQTIFELVKVGAARAEMEFIIKQRQFEIRRISGEIKIQIERENELSAKIELLTKEI